MFKKKILQRVKSLESFFGLNYSKPDDKDDYPEHFKSDWGMMVTMEQRLKALEDKVGIDKKK
jgi:hypothetical protein